MSIAMTSGAAAVLLVLAACGAPSDEATGGSGATDTDAAAASILDALPVKHSDGVDVCAALPGSEVAAAVGLPLTSTSVDPYGNSCSYLLRAAGDYDERIDVEIKERFTYDAMRAVADTFANPVADLRGIGVAAYTKRSADADREVWAVRGDGLYVKVQAEKQAWAESVARLALETLP